MKSLPAMSLINSARPGRLGLCILALLTLTACGKKTPGSGDIPGDPWLEASDPLLRLVPASESGIDFQNFIQESFELNITTHINTSNGGGVAILDVNRDSLQDVYFVSTSGPNKLYLNEGHLKFRDISESAGVTSAEGFEVAVTVADVNADGWQDIYICRAGPVVSETRRNVLFINNGDMTFTDRAREYGLDDKSASMGANFFDYDRDGDLDLYLLNYPVDFSYTSRINVRPAADGERVEPILDPIGEYDTDRLYRNDGPAKPDGTGGFTDVSKDAGIWNFGYGLSVSVEDFNRDGWMDVYVANDFIQPDRLYINNRNGTFTDRLGDFVRHTSQHTMGTDLSDFDNDGHFDLFAVDMLSESQYRKKTVLSTNSQNKYNSLIKNNYFEPIVRNVLQRNNGNGTFSDIGCMANVDQTDWSWSGLMVDLDNDMWKDLLVTNGYQREVTDQDFINFVFADIKAKGALRDQFRDVNEFLNLIPQYKLRDYVFRNRGDWTYENVTGKWLTAPATWSNGAAMADLDNDGDMDYLVNNINDTAFLYENLAREKTGHHYLQVVLEGPTANPDAIGATVIARVANTVQYYLMTPTKGIFSSVEHLVHFGLADHKVVDRLEVRWPDGTGQVLANIPADQRLRIRYTPGLPLLPYPSEAIQPLVAKTTPSGLRFRHTENPYIDFETVFLQPWALSELGPLLDTADVNGDGYTDVFIGNAFDQPGGLYAQKPDGSFRLVSESTWMTDKIYEDHGSIFFDADNDQDPDLLVIGGGYESTSPQAWVPRLYINEGGQFLAAKGAFPLLESVCLRGVALDFDLDGDQDILLGGRVSPGQYPLAPRSYVFRNDGNKFTDVTSAVAPAFERFGMISDLAVGQVDADPEMELLVAGEWTPLAVFDIRNGQFNLQSAAENGLAGSEGFWNRLVLADLDEDGDLDIVSGNLGLNTHYKPTADRPVECFVADYDRNGSLDPILTCYEGETRFPLVQKDVLIKQVPSMKKKFIYYKDYGAATLEDVLSDEQRKSSRVLQCRMVQTGWWKNENGRFSFEAFPIPAQVSVTQSILVADLDADGHLDILLAGNKYSMEVETGRMDAGNGTFLKGDGHGQFAYVDNNITGFWASGDVRDLAYLRSSSRPGGLILVGRNNDNLGAFRVSR